ncbi:MAG: hypothetical protein EBZ05_06370 [Verrucomicrobia bacterium]|nr:hypothetical protein [Verrucomicrobiota bacterium]
MSTAEYSITDFSLLVELLVDLVQQLQQADPRFFLFVVAGAFLLSAAMWWICSVFSNLWNKRYHLHLWHHLLCFFAAIITFFTTLIFFSLPYVKPLVEYSVGTWQARMESNASLWNETLDQCRKTCAKLGIPQVNPTGVTVSYSGSDGKKIEGIRHVSRIFANRILKDFWQNRPMLSLILWARGAEARAAMTESMVTYFDANPRGYMERADVVKVGAQKIREDLDRQIPKIVPYARAILVLAFLLVQAIPFGIIAYCSYRDIKVLT